MKTVKTMACFMAMIMASSVVLVSCKKDKEKEPEVQQTAETPQGKNEVVKTQFAISMPSQLKNGANRMPATTVQKKGMEQFQGMTGITLIPFAKPGEILGTDTRLGVNITLPDLLKEEVDSKANQAKVYSDVNIPLTTASFLFYAKSKASGTKFEVGSLVEPTMTVNNPVDISFSLEPIHTSEEVNTMLASDQEGGKLMAYLTSVATATDGVKPWYATDDAALRTMFDSAYSKIHGLSSAEVSRILTDLNKSLKPLRASNALANAIATAIANATYATVNGSDSVVLVSAWDNFPEKYDLPQGCFDIKWDATSHSFVEGSYSNMARPYSFAYPAQLWYYANSTIKTSNVSQATAYANTSNTWTEILALHTAPTNVNSMTRAVAIKDQIQYAVARFDVTVKLSSLTLADRSLEATGIATAVTVPSEGFPVTAVLVGGQQPVNFDFTSTASGSELTVYDKTMTNGSMKATASASATNHTLVLENGTENVRVAVEMVNTTGKDFYGAGNQLIKAGAKFYVVAQLNASEATTETAGHVFKQDYTTTANLTLKNLKTAYNTIPDLRTPKLELGFSVDLTWQAGHTYNIDFQ